MSSRLLMIVAIKTDTPVGRLHSKSRNSSLLLGPACFASLEIAAGETLVIRGATSQTLGRAAVLILQPTLGVHIITTHPQEGTMGDLERN